MNTSINFPFFLKKALMLQIRTSNTDKKQTCILKRELFWAYTVQKIGIIQIC